MEFLNQGHIEYGICPPINTNTIGCNNNGDVIVFVPCPILLVFHSTSKKIDLL